MEEGHGDIRIPRQKRSRETKEQILQSAEKLFRKNGFHGTNTKEIASSAGVAVGSVYAYFSDKKGIYLEVLNAYSARVFGRIPEYSIPPAGTPGRREHFAGQLRAIIDAHYAPELHRDLYAMYHQDPDLQRIVREWQKKAAGELQRSLQSGEAPGVEDPEAAAVLLHTFIESFVQHITMYGASIDEKRLIREFAVILDRYFTEKYYIDR